MSYRQLTEAEKASICERYLAGVSAQRIALDLGYATSGPAERVLKAAGLYETGRRFQGRYSPEQKAEIVGRYEAGESQGSLAAEFGCTRGNIRTLLVRRGVTLRGQGFPVDEALDRKIAAMRADRMTVNEVAAALGESKHRILMRSRALGLSERKMPRASKNPAWKGGRTFRHGTGYIYALIGPDDPMRAMAQPNGQVPEHRLVMARSLGRPLVRSETVHHINGVRTDNRLENLQLRNGNHGIGVAMTCIDCGSHNVRAVPLAD